MNKKVTQKACSCGLESPFSKCCEPLLLGMRHAITAEALMRSRYSAYVLKNEAYLLKTWHKSTRPTGIDLSGSENDTWLPLEIIACEAGQAKNIEGVVEFSTGYRVNGKVTPLHEVSRFCKENGHWFYRDGILKETSCNEKVGRNDLCPCGSGKKYKKCCGR